MAKAKAFDKRRKSIRNIRKITRTYELISTARFKRAMDRAIDASEYTRRIMKLVGNLVRGGLEVSHPLLASRAETKQAILLVLTANRGMCGGYNAGVLRLANAKWKELKKGVPDVHLEVSGKRGMSYFRFRKIIPDQRFTHFEDKPAFHEVEALAQRYLEDFQTGTLDRLDVAYTKFESSSRQFAVIETLLPIAQLEGANEEQPRLAETQYDFLPSAKSILDEVVPASFKAKLFKCFLDSAVSEQIARMTAMKAATENADSMIANLSMSYNRARQTQITNELLEIIGGAEALEK